MRSKLVSEICGGGGVILLAIWSGSNLIVSLVGNIQTVLTVGSRDALSTRALTWLFGTPWWVPCAAALILAMALIVLRTRSDIGHAREMEAMRAQIAELSSRPAGAIGPNTKHNAIDIQIGTSSPFDEIETFQSGARRRVVRAGVHNNGNGILSNCSFYIRLQWLEQGEVSVMLQKDFDLHPGQTRYIDIACYDEHFLSANLHGKYFTVCKPPAFAYNSLLMIPVDENPQKSDKHFIVLEARSTDASPTELECYLWIDHRLHGPRLRLEKA